jgi:peptide/nickel transport system substrate-binding protein
MTRPRRPPALLALVLVAAAACGPNPAETGTPEASLAPTAAPTPAASDLAFVPARWPADGSACDRPGGSSRISSIEAPDAKTVVFTLCAADGAFLARLAHPSMGIVDAADLARIAADPSAAHDVAGHGAYAIELWGGDNVQLQRVGAATSSAATPTVILRWAQDPAVRTADLVAASVDGIDAPTPAGLDAAATNPALTVLARPLLDTVVLGFGHGAAFDSASVRRAIAAGIDTDALAGMAFPAGSTAADHLAPCDIPSGCAGKAFRGLNGPSSTASLKTAKFNFDTAYTLTIPDAPIPGLADPIGVAAAVRDQLAANLGLTANVVTMPAAQFREAVDGGTLAGMYLDAVAAPIADPSAFYGPLLLDHPASAAAHRAGGAISKLEDAAAAADPDVRDAGYADAATLLRDSVPVAPLVHAGGSTVYRSDVKGAVASALGTDPLGAMTAGDRGQVVFEQASAPDGGWCGWQPSADAYRLCGLVTDGLYGDAAGSLDPTPGLASACSPNAGATVWTCRLRAVRTANGLVLDADDVVATFRAMADPSDPVHRALGDAAFSAWADIFGTASAGAPAPSPTPAGSTAPPATASPSAQPAASGSPAASAPKASGSPKATVGRSPSPSAS